MIDSLADSLPTAADVEAYRRDGACCLRGLFREWLPLLEAGIERNLREPGPHAANNLKEGEAGRFFDDYCNWQRIPEYRELVERSPAARVAAAIMGSSSAQFFHDHVLVKEPGTAKATPWHQDIPYYFLSGRQSVSFWIPADPVRETTLRFVAGSHLWDKWVLPVRWLTDEAFYGSPDDYIPVPDPDADPTRYRVLEWTLEPGDAVLFDFRTLHGARGNPGAARRRALSLRFVGDDVRYAERPGRTSPPYPGHGMVTGQRLRDDWFPVVWQA